MYIYIDDTLVECVVLDNKKVLLSRKNAALPLSNHLVFWTLSKNELIYWDDPQSLKKMDVESQLRSEITYPN